MSSEPSCGEIWLVRFEPSQGAEIDKTRPAVVVNPDWIGKLRLRIVVPVTSWNEKYNRIPWLVRLKANEENGLHRDSAADGFQVKSVSLARFVQRIGRATAEQVEEISAAIGLCVGI